MMRRKIHSVSSVKALVYILAVAGQTYSQQWIPLDGTGAGDARKKASVTVEQLNAAGNRMDEAIVDSLRQLKISITVPGIHSSKQTIEEQDYHSIQIPGITGQSEELGKPAVPVQIVMREIPFGARPSITVETVREKVLKGMNIVPAQKPESDSREQDRTFVKDLDTYGSSELYPGNHLLKSEVLTMRNRQFIRLEIALARTRPNLKELLTVSEISLRVTLDGGNGGMDKECPGSSRSMNSLFSTGAHTSDGSLEYAYGSAPETYMILMDDQFSGNAALQNFINWKRRKGYRMITVLTSNIDAGGAPDSQEIRNYMLGLSPDDYPSYLLIIGDETANNGVDGWAYWSFGTLGYTDLYYASREPLNSFPVPDLFYGRLPAINNNELTSMLQKVISMDRTPPRNSMYDRIIVASTIQDWDYNNEADRRFCETSDAIACYFEQDAAGVNYTCARAFTNPETVSQYCTWNNLNTLLWAPNTAIGARVWNTFVSDAVGTSRIQSEINRGSAMIFHRNHGDYGGWSNPPFSTNEVDRLANGNALTLVWSVNCLTGAYHSVHLASPTPNFMRQFLLHPNGGAYTVLAATSESPTWANDWLAHGLYTGLFDSYVSWHNASTAPDWSNDLPSALTMAEGSARKHGPNLLFGKTYCLENYASAPIVRTEFELYHIFGDPEGEIVVHTPQVQTVGYPASVPTGSQTVVVTTGDNGVQVCLCSQELGIHLVALSQNGNATFNINPAVAGSIMVTATGFGKRPYEGVIHVKKREGGNQVFGFEDPSLWSFTCGSGTLACCTTPKTEGNASMTCGGNYYREITCIPLNTSSINGETSRLAFDLYIGSNQPNPYWIGQTQMMVSCPSAGIYHRFIGALELTGKPFNVFNTMVFTLPPPVMSALYGNHGDFTISIILNTNYNSGPYHLDNMRFIP